MTDYWVKAREGRVLALDALRRLSGECGTGRTPRPPELGRAVEKCKADQQVRPDLRVVVTA